MGRALATRRATARLRAAFSGQTIVVALAALLLAPTASSAAGETVFYELPLATHATSMTAGPEGAIWFTGRRGTSAFRRGGGVIGRVSQDGEVRVFDLPARRYVRQIAAGPDGNLWFSVDYENRSGRTVARIGRISPDGAFDEYGLGNHAGGVKSVTAGPKGSVWFTAAYWVDGRRKEAVGRIAASGAVKRFPLPALSGPGRIVAGPDGNLWFTERGAGVPKIGRITPKGRLTHFHLPDRGREPTSIVVGPDGNLWFGERPSVYSRSLKSMVGRITTAGVIAEFRVPGTERTQALAAGPAGEVWFTSPLDQGPLGIGSIAPSGTARPLACLKATPCEIDADTLTIGANGELWFSASKYYPHNGGGGSGILEHNLEESEAGLVGRYVPPPQSG